MRPRVRGVDPAGPTCVCVSPAPTSPHPTTRAAGPPGGRDLCRRSARTRRGPHEMAVGAGGGRVLAELAAGGEGLAITRPARTGSRSPISTGPGGLWPFSEVAVTGSATEIYVDTAARQALSHRFDLALVADGHTASVRPDTGEYASPKESIADHHETFRRLVFPGRSIRVLPASEVNFAAVSPIAPGSPGRPRIKHLPWPPSGPGTQHRAATHGLDLGPAATVVARRDGRANERTG